MPKFKAFASFVFVEGCMTAVGCTTFDSSAFFISSVVGGGGPTKVLFLTSTVVSKSSKSNVVNSEFTSPSPSSIPSEGGMTGAGVVSLTSLN